MANEYVLQDRSTADKWALQVDDSQLKFTTTGLTSSADIIVEDKDVPGQHYEIYIASGQLRVETTVTVRDDSVSLDDVTTADVWAVEVRSGQLYLNNGVVVVVVSGFGVILRRRRR